jgi:3-mercaptopyruvate sulfurtransferase SseA
VLRISARLSNGHRGRQRIRPPPATGHLPGAVGIFSWAAMQAKRPARSPNRLFMTVAAPHRPSEVAGCHALVGVELTRAPSACADVLS